MEFLPVPDSALSLKPRAVTLWADEALLPQPRNRCLCLPQPCPRSPGISPCSLAALSLQPPRGSLSLTEPYRGSPEMSTLSLTKRSPCTLHLGLGSVRPQACPRSRGGCTSSLAQPSLGRPAGSFAVTQLSACQAGTSTLSLRQPSLSAALSCSRTDSASSRQPWNFALVPSRARLLGLSGDRFLPDPVVFRGPRFCSTSPLRPSPAVVGVLPVHASVHCLKFYTLSLGLHDSSVSLGACTSFLVPYSAFSSVALS